MTYKIIAAAVLSLGMGTVAFAQTPSTQGGEPPVYPQAWQGDIASALYADQHTLRSPEDIRTNWAKLSPEQQAQVKTDCNATTASVQTKPGEASPGADANTSLTEVCDMIGDM